MTTQSPLAAVGVWNEAPPGNRWANEGMQRLLGFLIEGAAAADLPVVWRLIVPSWLAAEAEADLRSLKAQPGVHWTLHTPPPPAAPTPAGMDASTEPEWVRDLAAFANAEVPVDGWLVPFPYFTGATLLARRYAVILPDAIPYSFPLSWHPDYWSATGWPVWRERTARVIARADTIVIFSEHVRGRSRSAIIRVTDPPHNGRAACPARPEASSPILAGRWQSDNFQPKQSGYVAA